MDEVFQRLLDDARKVLAEAFEKGMDRDRCHRIIQLRIEMTDVIFRSKRIQNPCYSQELKEYYHFCQGFDNCVALRRARHNGRR